MDNQNNQQWRQHAACHGQPIDIFFPNRGDNLEQINRAKQICATCPVIEACRQYALTFDSNQLPGIYGGLTQYERKRLRKRTA